MAGKKHKTASGDLIISIGDDGVPRVQTDDPIPSLDAFLCALSVETTQDALNRIGDSVDLDVFDDFWAAEGFSFSVGNFHLGTVVAMTFPFSIGEFWEELEAVETAAEGNHSLTVARGTVRVTC
jgi:hypothetical protein